MNKKFITYLLSILAVLALLAAAAGLNMAVWRQNETANQKTSQQSKLNVAIVNEDRAIMSTDGVRYSLGESYIKTIERDDSQNWFVVSRGTADSGLRSGKYHLAVTIPSDFSKKVLDINNVNVDQVNVKYEVNANGNQQLETEAAKLGKDIVADLNSQLVDMYMASILSNLYTAQLNIQAITEEQSSNVGVYRANLLGAATALQNGFPILVSSSGSSLTANEALVQTLRSSAELFGNLDTSQQSFNGNLNSLVEQRAQDQISYGEFVTALMEMNREVLSGQITTLLNTLQKVQGDLSSQIQAASDALPANGGAVTAPASSVSVTSLDEAIASLKEALATEQTNISSAKNDISSFVESYLKTTYQKDTADLTLFDLLKPAGMTDQLTSAIDNLPAADSTGINDLISDMTVLDGDAADSVHAFNIGQAAVYNSTPTGNATLRQELTDAKKDLEDRKNDYETVSVSQTSSLSAKVSIVVPSHITLNSWSLNGENKGTATQDVDVDLSDSGNSFSFDYTYNDNIPSDTSESIQIVINGISVASLATEEEAYRKAEAAYARKVEEINGEYDKVNTLMAVFGQNAKDLMTKLLADAIDANLSGISDSGLQQKIQDLERQRNSLASQIAEVQKTNETVTTNISDQLQALSDLQNQVNNVSTLQSSASEKLSASDSSLTSLSSELQSLLSATANAKSSSDTNVTQADQVNSVFASFNQSVESAQNDSQKLSKDAEDLMVAFNEELEESGDFVEAFVKVLNNAYSDGVANDVLLKFLSNPVGESSSSVKASVNVYRPFTWILLLEVVTFFMAYLFANYNVIKKAKDKFTTDRLAHTDILNVGILSLLAAAIGILLGILSGRQLGVSAELLPSWVLLVALFSFLLTQGQYFLLKNLKAVGMGLILFMMMSFVYLSNAIGTTVGLSRILALLKRFNPLSLLEGYLSAYFDSSAAGLAVFLLLIAAVLALTAVNVFFSWSFNLRKWSEA
ncbi:type VII secretion protein EsaA [Streptococcus sp. H31]|uniref:type VII secretion protein EsaA n=1 Tax=Streptococcus huangxiaojuni TaxID=3237239 RepID=UPI0034A40C47